MTGNNGLMLWVMGEIFRQIIALVDNMNTIFGLARDFFPVGIVFCFKTFYLNSLPLLWEPFFKLGTADDLHSTLNLKAFRQIDGKDI